MYLSATPKEFLAPIPCCGFNQKSYIAPFFVCIIWSLGLVQVYSGGSLSISVHVSGPHELPVVPSHSPNMGIYRIMYLRYTSK